jgi:hypothetical protein
MEMPLRLMISDGMQQKSVLFLEWPWREIAASRRFASLVRPIGAAGSRHYAAFAASVGGKPSAGSDIV